MALKQGSQLLLALRRSAAAGGYVPPQVWLMLPTALQPLTPQLAGQCDLFSACVVLWEMLTGQIMSKVPGILVQPAATLPAGQQRLIKRVPLMDVWGVISVKGTLQAMEPLLLGASLEACMAARVMVELVVHGLHTQGAGVTLQQLQAAAEGLAAQLPLSQQPADWALEAADEHWAR
jgi:hypothetical protein